MPMTRGRKWLLGAAAFLSVLLLAAILLASLIPSDEELAASASARLSAALGVEVRIGAVHWTLLPLPSVIVEQIHIAQPQPITVKRVSLYPDLKALWGKRIRFNQVALDGAVVPQLSLRGLGAGAAKESDSPWMLDTVPLEHFDFSDVTWITRRGIPVVYAGNVDFDPQWRPRTALVFRPGFAPRTDMSLKRLGEEDRWAVATQLGGGTANGEVHLQTAASGRMKLAGRLKPREVEVAAALEAFNRRPALSGKASGDTTLVAEGDNVMSLAQSLNTKTPFVMGPGKLLRFDLDKAVRTVGKDHSGQTPLDSVTGLLETQNTPDGMVTYFRDVRAKSGALSASGNAKLFNRHIDADFAVDLVDGIVGVPLKVSGPTTDVKVSVPAGAVAGAVVGTAILPGVGTAIGARIGATIGRLFGPSPASSAAAPKSNTPAGRKSP